MTGNDNNLQLDVRFDRRIPADDNVERDVCSHCGFVDYDNPKIVVGAVVRQATGILLCKRAIAPRIGFWTLPAGYLELNESPSDGATRETFEEANAKIRIVDLLAVYSIARISQVQLIYRAILTGDFSPGPESQEVALFEWDQLPWAQIAFPSVSWALYHDREAANKKIIAPFTNPSDERRYQTPDVDGL